MEHGDLISRSALQAEIDKLTCNGSLYDADEVDRLLKEAPAVDAVVPVRCKGCESWRRNSRCFGRCAHPIFDGELSNPGVSAFDRKESDFCSYGVRRTDERLPDEPSDENGG